MITIDTRKAEAELKDQMDKLSDRNIVVANTRAINTALLKARTQFRKAAKAEYNLDSEALKNIDVDKATYNKIQGLVTANAKPISLSRFNPKFDTNSGTATIKNTKIVNPDGSKSKNLTQLITGKAKKKKGKGVTVEIKRGQRKTISYAFLIQGGGNAGISLQVWARGSYGGGKFNVSKERLPITPLKTTSPFSAITNDAVIKPVVAQVETDFANELSRQIDLLSTK